MEERYYTVREACEKLHRSNRTIYAYIRSGQLKATKIIQGATNSKYIIAESDLAEFMKKGAQPGYYQKLYPRPHRNSNTEEVTQNK